ncbi:MAG: secondary thiamine-phosphate synthase enzyme YjbQ [Candidatus Marinimicrobia bacterium]|jgi:secondary thiamine-phosphate synthase enzyme|nr:secondary thiamine-phosphate synthase enzyme YjbQ [Candidatus Neomarinimicrobiota bacterium]MDP6853490.1 secondary thiamine-phosphate synthase enzyme YjbQ [Candidatus Neomarinimicrobiota bacterium]MDP6936662.1 secondary thiamine-phosphate synthase enzyme YjbQ [Candidatus Neomarinimicrobiota bacterium]
MNCIQKEFTISAKSRGFHSITGEVISNLPNISNIESGIAQIFIKHTSASLTINEDADSTVLLDFESHFNTMVPEDQPYYRHTYEGSDDMPAHLKASLLGSSVQIPVTGGKLNLGTWQGIYLCEHRNHAGDRKLVVTIWGS